MCTRIICENSVNIRDFDFCINFVNKTHTWHRSFVKRSFIFLLSHKHIHTYMVHTYQTCSITNFHFIPTLSLSFLTVFNMVIQNNNRKTTSTIPIQCFVLSQWVCHSICSISRSYYLHVYITVVVVAGCVFCYMYTYQYDRYRTSSFLNITVSVRESQWNVRVYICCARNTCSVSNTMECQCFRFNDSLLKMLLCECCCCYYCLLSEISCCFLLLF